MELKSYQKRLLKLLEKPVSIKFPGGRSLNVKIKHLVEFNLLLAKLEMNKISQETMLKRMKEMGVTKDNNKPLED